MNDLVYINVCLVNMKSFIKFYEENKMKFIAVDKFQPDISLLKLRPGESLYITKSILVNLGEKADISMKFGNQKLVTKVELYIIALGLLENHRTTAEIIMARTNCQIKPHIACIKKSLQMQRFLKTKKLPNVFTVSNCGLERILLMPGEIGYLDLEYPQQGWVLPISEIKELEKEFSK